MALSKLDADKHVIQCVFTMFVTVKQNSFAVATTNHSTTSNDREIYNILGNTLRAMKSYSESADEEVNHEFYF